MVLAVVAFTAPLGDTLLSLGMKRVGPVSLDHLSNLIYAIATPQILLGIALLICFFASYLASLSWADLTFVLPATSIGNVIVALLARFWLHEQISPGTLDRDSADYRRGGFRNAGAFVYGDEGDRHGVSGARSGGQQL